jgi:hypothetical protein
MRSFDEIFTLPIDPAGTARKSLMSQRETCGSDAEYLNQVWRARDKAHGGRKKARGQWPFVRLCDQPKSKPAAHEATVTSIKQARAKP